MSYIDSYQDPMCKGIEYASPEAIEAFQAPLLRETVAYVASHSPFYKRLYASLGIDLQAIHSARDLHLLPTVSKQELQSYNWDFACVPRQVFRDFLTTSGTSGNPVVFGLTEGDLMRLGYNESLSFYTAGCREGDCIQLMTTIDKRFMAGLAYMLGARTLGIPLIRVGAGVPSLQFDTIFRLKPTVAIAVPSFLIVLAQYAAKHHISLGSLSLRRAICIGESIRNTELALNTLGQKLHALWPELELLSTYAATEMQTGFTECCAHCGGHMHPELIVCEFLDAQGQPVDAGQPGELTITTLGVEGMPLVRFRTGDICTHYEAPCSCGRTTLRIGTIIGRKGQMIKYKGTTFYPPALFDILDALPWVSDYVVETYTNDIGTDGLIVRLATAEASERLTKEIVDRFRAGVRVVPEIIYESPESLEQLKHPAGARKEVKFIDSRHS